MSKHWRVVALVALVVIAAGVAVLAYRVTRPAQAELAVPQVPAAAQESLGAALSSAGYPPLAPPVWAAARPGWVAPGDFQAFFAAPGGEGGADIFGTAVTVGAGGQVQGVRQVTRLTDTPAGDESAPVLADGWLAFATRVGDRYQTVTCLPLAALDKPEIFALAQPAEQASLSFSPPSAGQPTILQVTVNQAGSETQLTIEPATRRIQPEGVGLTYTPIIQGEMSWLPTLVSRIRELPFVGPEKIAFIENVFFTASDYVQRLVHGGGAAVRSEEVVGTTPSMAAATIEPTTTPTEAAAATAAPTLTPPSPLEGEGQKHVTPTAAATATDTATATFTPRPATPTPTATTEGTPLPEGIVRQGSVKPDPQRPYAVVDVLELDPSLLQLKMIPGTWEPRPTTGLVGSGVIPEADWPALVAAFNGGFAAMHGSFGMMVDRKVYLPARDGVATLAVYEDGSLRLGTWGTDLKQTPDMVSYRQNCPPLIENGTITAETGKMTLWGLSVANEVYLYRSGLGVTAAGRLVYAAGRSLSAYTLARALQMAGAVYAMQLDVDEYHVVFITYNVQAALGGGPPQVTGRKLRPDMRGFDSFFLRPFQLDFFYLARRPERLANAVRLAPTPLAVTSEATPLPQDLPGTLAFAGSGEGTWKLYSMQPGRPETRRRLTDGPADALYPSWSPDGQQLAFAARPGGNLDIYTLELASGAVRRVTTAPSEEGWPAWSPDGKKLAYQSDRNGQSDIYVITPDGADETRLTLVQSNNEAPHWSPDGQFLTFDSDLDVSEAVHASINAYIMNADGSNPRRLADHAESPAWSPDGRTIAFTGRRGGQWQVLLINVDGSGLRQLTSGAYDARYPAWSPDGRWLAFAGNEAGHWELYAIPAAGGQPVRLTFGASDSSYPAWGP